MQRFLITLTLFVLVSACVKPPQKELTDAEGLLKRAQLMHAPEYAPTEYQAAYDALNDAREAMDDSRYKEAMDSLEFSSQHSQRAIMLAQEAKNKATEEEAQLIAEQQARQEAMKARQKEEQRKVRELAIKAINNQASRPETKVEPVSNYAVGEGETLWTISAQPQVYDEGLLWPLLYQANRDQIKDPRQIFPGQTLSIRRDMNRKELEEARQKARESDIFPVPKAANPSQ